MLVNKKRTRKDPFFIGNSYKGLLSHIAVHEDEMTEASAHDEQMKYFMRTKILMSGVKKRELQCIYDPADCVNNPTGEQPAKGSSRQAMDDRTEYKDTDPAHGNIDHGGKPFRAGDPAGFQDHAEQGKTPDNGKQGVTKLPTKDSQADRGIGTGDQYKNHHVINLTEDA